jgi:hypothetical protein
MSLIGLLHSADFTSSVPQPLSMSNGANRYIVRGASLTNCSTAPYGITFEVIDERRLPADVIVPATSPTSGLDLPSDYVDLPVNAAICSITTFSSPALYLLVTTALSAPCTGDIYVWGDILA